MSYFYNFGKIYDFHPDMLKGYQGTIFLVSEKLAGKMKMFFYYKGGECKTFCYVGKGSGMYEVNMTGGWIGNQLVWHITRNLDELFL